MAITGNLEEASLPDVLQLLSLARKTGCLSITDRVELGSIYVEDGRVIYASVLNRPDRIGDLLVQGGAISPAERDEAMARQSRHRDRKLGEILLELGRICRADLQQSLQRQIEEAVYSLLGWTRGRFTFQPGVRPESEDLVVSLSAESLMLEGARRIDEWSVIERRIPSFNMVFQIARERLTASGTRLTPMQQSVVDLMDGERTLTHVVDESGLLEFDVAKAVYGLVNAGFARPVGRSEASSRVSESNDPYDESRTLGQAFYGAGMFEEARRAFSHVLEHAATDVDAAFHLGLIAFREHRWQDAIQHFEQVTAWGGPRTAVAHNLALCYEAVGRTREAETSAAEAASATPDDPRVLIGWSILALSRGDGGAAIKRLDRARLLVGTRSPGSMWYWARSLAAAIDGDLRADERILRQGLEEEPDHPVLRNNLAVLLEAHGEIARAESVLTGTLADEAAVPQVSKNVGDLAYRRARYDEAWDAYQRSIRIHPRLGTDVYYKLGDLALKRSCPDLARQYWQKAVELDPNDPRAATRLTVEPEPRGVPLGIGG